MTKSSEGGKSTCFFIIRRYGLLRNSSLVLRHFSSISQHFLDGGVASEDTAQAVLAQCYHSKLHSLLLQRNRWRAFID
jgi:hypothetical protein